MEADDSDVGRAVKAAPLTVVIAKRVRELRVAADMRGSGLASRLNDLGVPWTRTTVAKFETFQRAVISVQELLALALALAVPPAALLVDPAADRVPVAAGVDPDPWHTLRWLIGRSLPESAADMLVSSFHQAIEALEDLEAMENPRWDGPPTEQQLAALDSSRAAQLRKLRGAARLLADQGLRVPVPDHVFQHAERLGIDLRLDED